MNNYQETIDWIHQLRPFGEKPGLKRMEWLLERLDHPENKIKFIHVGGTNGKGSTVSYLNHIFMEAGIDVGTFTSPFIERFNERISFNGSPIEDEELVQIARKVRLLVEELSQTELGSPTTFEVITTIAFIYFAEIVSPDIVIFEVGIGGKYDSTNVIIPLISLITNVGFDHMNILGDTIEEIAFQKAGIIKANIPIMTTAEIDHVLAVFKKHANDLNAPFFQLDKDFHIFDYCNKGQNQTFTITTPFESENTYEITMQGEHQIKNASLAIMAVHYLKEHYGFNINNTAIKRGLKQTTWLGRFEILLENPLVILDGAHNKEGIEALAKTIEVRYPNKNIYLIFSATKEKEVESLLPPLYKLVKEISFTTFDFQRAALASDLYDQSTFDNKVKVVDWRSAIEEKLPQLKEEDLLLITGSLYFISDVRKWFIAKFK